jgi:hypothetical protein
MRGRRLPDRHSPSDALPVIPGVRETARFLTRIDRRGEEPFSADWDRSGGFSRTSDEGGPFPAQRERKTRGFRGG